MLKEIIEKVVSRFADKKEKYAEIYLRAFNRETKEEDVDYHEALRWIESNVPRSITGIIRETVTNSQGVTYSAPVLRIALRYNSRRELKSAVNAIKARYNREKLIVVMK
jgi:hypothetical protein